MKIALVSQEYPPETARGGIGSQTYAKAKGLSALGHDVYVISRSIEMIRDEKMDGSISVIRIPGMENTLPEMTYTVQWITHSIVVAAEIEALHSRIGLDIIDFPEWGAEGYIYLLNRREWNTVPVVIQLHGPLVMLAHTMGWPDIDSDFYKVGLHMESTAVQLADALYTSSECSAQWIKNYYSPQSQNIPTIHLGVDASLFTSSGIKKNKNPTIIFIGKIVPNKGVEELVDACSALVKIFPDLQLRLIGTGDNSLIKKLEQKALQQDGTTFLQFAGYIQQQDLPKELAGAHVFVSASWYEGGPGFVFLEAMACGLPVIGCSGSGIDEIVTNGLNGLLVPPKDTESLGNAIHKILCDQQLRETMGANALKYAREECDRDVCLKKLESFYFDVVKTKAVR